MSDLEHARSLLRMAQRDLNAMRGMMSPALGSSKALFSDEVFGFHAQQAAENCLKAWIASLGRRYPRTHDLMALIGDLSTAGEDTRDLDVLVDLTPFAVEYRYESLEADDEDLNRGDFLFAIQSLFERLTGKFGPVD
jgi:HEPN domain